MFIRFLVLCFLIGGTSAPGCLKAEEPPPDDKAKDKKAVTEVAHHNGETYTGVVDLDICNGQGAPEPVPEDKEDLRAVGGGAFTVANLNNTNGNAKDGKPVADCTEDDGSATAYGRDEVDLMRLILRKPDPDEGGNVTLTVKSGKVKFWKSALKKEAITKLEFPTKELEKTIWVEAMDVSAKLRDIEIVMEYRGRTDTVLATAVWAKVTGVLHDKGDDIAQWKDLTDPPFTLLQFNGKHLGLRPIDQLGVTNWIAFQFTVLPSGIGKEPGVKFDCTRQKNRDSVGRFKDGKVLQESFPFPPKNEQPNDDSGEEVDESRAPTADDHMYQVDGPGLAPEGMKAFNQYRYRGRFLEFMRVSFDGKKPIGDVLGGSICSDKFPWRAVHYLELNGQEWYQWNRLTGEEKETDDNCVTPE